MDAEAKFEIQKQVGIVLRLNRERVNLSLDQVVQKNPILSANHLREIEDGKRPIAMRTVFKLFAKVYRPSLSEILFFCTNGRMKPDYLS